MRPTVLLATALTLAALPVHATPQPVSDPVNGCELQTVPDPADPARVYGVLYGEVAVADLAPGGLGATPVGVTLTCSVQGPGEWSHSAPDLVTVSATGTAVAVVPPTAFTAPAPDEWGNRVALCSRADVATLDGDTYTFWSNSQNSRWRTDDSGTCTGAPQCQSLGPECNYLAGAIEEVIGLTGIPDPLLCPVLAARSPGVPGLVDVDPTGDTYVAGELLWDCPPYRP